MTKRPPGLRERTRRAVKFDLTEMAVELFLRDGFEATTVDQLAAAAGISRSSFFRYFPTKDDVLLDAFGDAHVEIGAALADRPAAERPWTALRRSFDDLVRDVEAEAERARPLIRMLFETPSLHSAYAHRRARWADDIADGLTPRLGADPADHLRAGALTNAALSCLEVAEHTWARADDHPSLARTLDTAMEAVAPLE